MLGITMQLDISTKLKPQIITIIYHHMKKVLLRKERKNKKKKNGRLDQNLYFNENDTQVDYNYS